MEQAIRQISGDVIGSFRQLTHDGTLLGSRRHEIAGTA
jgi:hypothetical protein